MLRGWRGRRPTCRVGSGVRFQSSLSVRSDVGLGAWDNVLASVEEQSRERRARLRQAGQAAISAGMTRVLAAPERAVQLAAQGVAWKGSPTQMIIKEAWNNLQDAQGKDCEWLRELTRSKELPWHGNDEKENLEISVALSLNESTREETWAGIDAVARHLLLQVAQNEEDRKIITSYQPCVNHVQEEHASATTGLVPWLNACRRQTDLYLQIADRTESLPEKERNDASKELTESGNRLLRCALLRHIGYTDPGSRCRQPSSLQVTKLLGSGGDLNVLYFDKQLAGQAKTEAHTNSWRRHHAVCIYTALIAADSSAHGQAEHSFWHVLDSLLDHLLSELVVPGFLEQPNRARTVDSSRKQQSVSQARARTGDSRKPRPADVEIQPKQNSASWQTTADFDNDFAQLGLLYAS